MVFTATILSISPVKDNILALYTIPNSPKVSAQNHKFAIFSFAIGELLLRTFPNLVQKFNVSSRNDVISFDLTPEAPPVM